MSAALTGYRRADGTFGIMKRPADRGKGLDGVAAHESDYFNPFDEVP